MSISQLTTYNPDGSVQFDSNLQTYALAFIYQVPVAPLTTFTLANGQSVTVGLISFGNDYANFPVTDIDIAAVGMVDGHWYGSAQYELTRGFYGLNSALTCWTSQPAGSTASIYVFRETKSLVSGGNFGLQLINEQGQITYDATKYPTRAVGYLNNGQSFNSGATSLAVVQSGMAWTREITSENLNFWLDTYPTALKNGSNISSYPLIFNNSGSGGRFSPGKYVDLPQQDLILDVSSLDMSLVGPVPPPPPNASRAQGGADLNTSAVLRIVSGSGNASLRLQASCRHSATNNSSVDITGVIQVRNLTTGSGWSNVPGASQTVTASTQRIPGEPLEVTPGVINYGLNFGVPIGHTLEFRAFYTQDQPNKIVAYNNTYILVQTV